MSLHIEKIGQGEPLVMIHGWGMHSDMWMQARDLLGRNFELHLIDLPGMGHSENIDVYHLHTVAEKIAEKMPANAYVLGWSLGGLIATKVAVMTPVKKLILVGSTPCFVQRDDWSHGMPSEVFESFFAGAVQDYQGTMNKLLALIAMGSKNARATSKVLREALALRPVPNQQGLLGALDILRTSDLRQALSGIDIPTLLIHGEHDKLAPVAAAQWMSQQLLQAELHVIKGAAHEPFISHPQDFTQRVTEFLQA
ncbi:MAG: carboxylesterase of pimeloyl-CoA synthesis [Pseudomonadota bacterium]